jgi:hypothetical protein
MEELMDFIYQLMVFQWIYPGEALIVSCILACIPYLLIRGPIGRPIHWRQTRKPV